MEKIKTLTVIELVGLEPGRLHAINGHMVFTTKLTPMATTDIPLIYIKFVRAIMG